MSGRLTHLDERGQSVTGDVVCRLHVETRASARDATGEETKAPRACAGTNLTLSDMVKGVDRSALIGPIQLTEKTDGKSRHFRR
ncbi:MAG: cyclic pyranopterin monophosphate synthase MoaC [Acidobacteriota bacterium]